MSWVRDYAVAVQFDIDKHRELALSLKIMAVPTILGFHLGVEFDRLQGHRSARECLAWFAGIESGRTELETARAAAGDGTRIGPRLDLAILLTRLGRDADATDEYAWLPCVTVTVGMRRLADSVGETLVVNSQSGRLKCGRPLKA